jgi:apolipoprotein N-acyltransferase
MPLGVVGLVLAWGAYTVRSTPVRQVGTVSILQPSIGQSLKWNKSNEKATYDQFDRLVMEAKEKHPDLIVWPETASPEYLLFKNSTLERVRDIVRRSGTFNLVGCLDAEALPEGDTRYYNGAVQFSPEGSVEGRYHKHHLVPFGEFVPLQKYLTFLGPVVGDLGDFDAGDCYQRFQARGFSYTPMICYEVIFPGDVRAAFQTGAEVLVNISNDAWYGWTASAYQHAMMAVVRAAEEHRPLLRSSNTGISLATDPFGNILSSASLYEEKVLTADVWTVRSGPTLYSTMGNWFPWFCLTVVLGWLLLAAIKGRRNEMPVQPPPGGMPPVEAK